MSKENNQTRVKRCQCKSEYQDQKQGAGMRLHIDRSPVGKNKGRCRCTVCGKEKEA